MTEIFELLDRATPNRLHPPDVEHLQRRATARRRRRSAALGATVVLVFAVVTAAVVTGRPDSEVVTKPADEVPATVPDLAIVPDAATWTQAAPQPFTPRVLSFTATTDDGRVLVWGGNENLPELKTLLDGGIYDPDEDRWESIPPAPLGDGSYSAALGGDRLIVLSDAAWGRAESAGDYELDPPFGAVFDLDSGRWGTVDPPTGPQRGQRQPVWDGEVLALVSTGRGTGDGPSVDRWSEGAGWTQGAAPPLSVRYGAYPAAADGRLALWGGQTEESDPGFVPVADLDDGAIYDLAADRWTRIPPGPLPVGVPMLGAALWADGKLVVACDPAEGDGNVGGPLTGAVFDPEARRWDPLPPRPQHELESGVDVSPREAYGFDDDPQRTLVVSGPGGDEDRAVVLDPAAGAWRSSPTKNVWPVAETSIAFVGLRGPGPSDGQRIAPQVLLDGAWRAIAEAPFADTGTMSLTGITVAGNRVVFVDGAAVTGGTPTGETWVLDLDG